MVAGACAGAGFTVSLLIATIAFRGQQLNEARLGTLGSVIGAPIVASLILVGVRRLPSGVRARQLSRTAEDILDLVDDVDAEQTASAAPTTVR